MYLKTYDFESKTYAAGGKVNITLAGQPQGEELTHILLEFKATVANASGGDVNIYPRALAFAFSRIYLDSPRFKVRSTGRMLWRLYRMTHGKSLCNQAVTITNGNSGTVTCFLHVAAVDPNAFSPLDCAQPVGLFHGKTLDIDFDPSNTVQTGVTISSANLYSTGYYVPGRGGVLPSTVVIDFEDWNQATANLKLGITSHLFLFDASSETVTQSEYSSITCRADGVTVINDERTSQLIAEFNDTHAMGASQDNELEQLPDDTVLMMPIITPRHGYKVSQLVLANETLRIDLKGSANGGRFAQRIIAPSSPETDNEHLSRLGVASPASVPRAPKTASKVSLSGRAEGILSRFLPVRFHL